jgi:hypothetical protein
MVLPESSIATTSNSLVLFVTSTVLMGQGMGSNERIHVANRRFLSSEVLYESDPKEGDASQGQFFF